LQKGGCRCFAGDLVEIARCLQEGESHGSPFRPAVSERSEDLLLIFLKAGKIQGTLLNALRSRDHDGGCLKILYYHQVSILKPNYANRHIIIIIPCDNRGLGIA